jgi:hypothetical protein
LTQNNGSNGPADREEENQIMNDPALINRVRQDLDAVMTPPESGFRSRRAAIMSQLQAEAGQSGLEEPTQRFAAGQGEPTHRFTVPPAPLSGVTPPFQAAPPPPVSIESRRVERRASRVSGWLGALAAALVLLVIAGAVLMYLANNQARTSTLIQASNPNEASTTAAGIVAATTAVPAPAVASAPLTPNADSAASSAATAGDSTKASATTVAAATTAAAAGNAPAAAAAAATTAAAAAGATTSAGSLPPIAGSVTPAALVTSGPGSQARNTGLPPFPGSTPISSLGSGRPIKFILTTLAPQALTSQTSRQLQGLDDPTIQNYNFSGSKVSGLKSDEVITFYQEQATAAGYRFMGVTALQQDSNGNKLRWIYLSKGTERVGILVVDATDDEVGSTFGLKANETGIIFATA